MKPNSILVVDDDAEMRESVARVLAAAGYVVEVAEDGEQAIEVQRARPAEVLITDVFMPTRDGLETIQFFRESWPAVPIIAMTGGSPTGEVDDYLKVAKVAGAKVTLRKPFPARELLESLNAL
jgi:two-component system, chemotaxis family, chemotaxis protein CheY